MFEYKFSTFHFSSELPVDRLIYSITQQLISTLRFLIQRQLQNTFTFFANFLISTDYNLISNGTCTGGS